MTRFYGALTEDISKREREHMEKIQAFASECVVLLENDGTLPLKADGRNIALYGNGARRTIKGGTGSGDVYSRNNVTVEQGLENVGFTITTKSWLSGYDQLVSSSIETYQTQAILMAKERGVTPITIQFEWPFKEPQIQEITVEEMVASNAKTAIYVLGRNSGEGADRQNVEGDYRLSTEELTALDTISRHYEQVILLLNVGSIVEIAPLKNREGIHAMLLMGQLGNMSGQVIAEVLIGKQVPSGKLTDTWAVSYEDYPSSAGFGQNDGNVDDEYYTEGIYVGYRYFDTFQVAPAYCFGYGKGYTTLNMETQQVRICENKIHIVVKVTNAGLVYPGKEVVQVYYSAPQATLQKPYQELVAFSKTKLLNPGESELLSIAFDIETMASYSEKEAGWILEAGEYLVRVGNSSRNTHIQAVIQLNKTHMTHRMKNLFTDTDPVMEIQQSQRVPYQEVFDLEEMKRAPKLTIPLGSMKTKVHQYQQERQQFFKKTEAFLDMDQVLSGDCTLEDLVAQLTVEEMAELCVGTVRGELGKQHRVVGDHSSLVPGAAGDTSSVVMESRKVKNLILADGPAGLRLQRHFMTSKDGKLLSGNGQAQSAEEVIYYYQFCTAIPIGTSLASSWNVSLIEESGKIVGKEMKEFHVDLWLAPAMNIHRNPLCGRNFEYYSEDPLISGKCAAAMTRGVQKEGAGGTTIKHFAANNQESNRFFSNSHVSERALREIYLKNFEIAIQEAQPLAMMTSYNLINGYHAANHWDLLQSLARDEWGYEGIMMTDWYTSQDVPKMTGFNVKKYPISSSVGCIYTGNDLQMPGCQKNVDDIIDAIQTEKEIDGYALTLGDLQHCVYRILKCVNSCL